MRTLVGRVARSGRALAVALVLLALAVLVLMQSAERAQSHRAAEENLHSARLLSRSVEAVSLTVRDGRGALAPGAADHLSRVVAGLQSAHLLSGLELWRSDGSLLWADATHDPDEQLLPADERRDLSRRPEVVIRTPGGEDELEGSLDVLQLRDLDGDGRPDAVVEVVFPPGPYDSAVTRSRTVLWATSAALLVLVSATALLARRRLRRRSLQALSDGLTGLGNRVQLQESAPAVLAHPASLLLLDLDGFKDVNDTLGHEAGDDLLVQVARALEQDAEPGEVLVRLGGDEFAVLVPGTVDAGLQRATAVRRAVEQPFTVASVAVRVGVSVGVASAPDDATDLPGLLRRADVAMYQAKRGCEGVRRWSASLDRHDSQQLSLLAGLAAAIDGEQLRLHYQPKLQAADGRALSVEALVRWQHPEHGLLSPLTFVPLAERTALIRPLTEWVLRRAAEQCVAWRRTGLDVAVAVNVSPRSLLDDSILELVAQTLTETGLPAHALDIEITESAVAEDPDRAFRTLVGLHELGVTISIDDFGAGYTCLAHLRTLPVDRLKLDRSFVSGMSGSAGDEAVVRGMIALAHDLGLGVVAEGVEDHATGERLAELGCDQLQGFAYSRPLPPDEAVLVLQAMAGEAAVAHDRGPAVPARGSR
ncbi:putative bifunctional diguanylate cyclase/phosphodiesterase [Motilibacter peucedani]|uniref:putative bifunctional diguanylate cyclase/phosphodiesterase n=1 Tax=Motilibacter peucedani TaxID=598650 RepID=UPI0011C41D37|nr:EAL domain-containing protein [Motilibacter peucedani]